MPDLDRVSQSAGHLIAAILHKLGETSITITEQDLQELPHTYERVEQRHDENPPRLTIRLVPVPSSDPQLPLENMQKDA